MYDDWEQESHDSFFENPWVERNNYGVFDIKTGKQIVYEGVNEIEVKGEDLSLQPNTQRLRRFYPDILNAELKVFS